MSSYRRRLILANQLEENIILYGNSVQDGTPTPEAPIDIMSVENPTIKIAGKNLYKLDIENVGNRYPHFGEASLIEKTENGVIVQGKVYASGAGTSVWYNGWFQPYKNGSTSSVYLRKGDKVTVSADVTWLDITNYDGTSKFGCYLIKQNTESNNTGVFLNKTPASTDVGITYRVKATHNIKTDDGYYIPIFTLNSCKMKIENIQISFDSNENYEPYEEDLIEVKGYTLRGIGDYKDRIYTKDGKVWFEQCIYYIKPLEFTRMGEGNRAVIAPLPHPNDDSTYSTKKSNFGKYSLDYTITKSLHWYLAKVDGEVCQIWLIPSIDYQQLWSTKEEAWKHLTETIGIYPEFQYILAIPIITEITGSLAEKILAIDKSKNITITSANGVSGRVEVIEE